MLLTFDKFGINKISEIINEICDSGNILEDCSRSIFIVMPKRCVQINMKTIGIQLNKSHDQAYNFNGRVHSRAGTVLLYWRHWNKKWYHQNDQYECKKGPYLCFVDYANAFDNVKHKNVFELIGKLDISRYSNNP